jgi:hypothetical protein
MEGGATREVPQVEQKAAPLGSAAWQYGHLGFCAASLAALICSSVPSHWAIWLFISLRALKASSSSGSSIFPRSPSE